MKLGIIGLPNVGKSTLFNALLKRQMALAANYPFATIEPNVGIVDVPDEKLSKIAEIINKDYSSVDQNKNIPEKIIPATIEFNDIAGLVKGASQGEGLGNKFLSHIRQVNALIHVVRNFSDENVIREGSVSPKDDIEIVNTELIVADLSTIQNRIQKHSKVLKSEKSKENVKKLELYKVLEKSLFEGLMAFEINIPEHEKDLIKDLNLLTIKPVIYVLNVDEDQININDTQRLDLPHNSRVIKLNAKIEAELSSLAEDDQKLYLQELNIQESGLDKVIKEGYDLLGLQTYYTAGPQEVRAWTIEKGTKAPQAAGVIHTDFEKGFVKAMVVSYDDLIDIGSYKKTKDAGKLRMEGKNYVMQEGDIVEFRFNV